VDIGERFTDLAILYEPAAIVAVGKTLTTSVNRRAGVESVLRRPLAAQRLSPSRSLGFTAPLMHQPR